MLKKLIEDISLKAEEVRDNLAEKDRLESEINGICKKNYLTIIDPVIKEYSELLNYLGKCVRDRLCIWNEAVVTHNERTYYGIKLTTAGKDADLYISLLQSTEESVPITTDTNDPANICWRNRTNDLHMDMVHDKLLTVNVTNQYNIMFINEDACSKFLDAINYILAKRLEYYMGGFDDTNSELIGRIKELVGILKAGHIPVKKEDGTVEVMIGGKKFVGKLEEDIDGTDDN